MVIAGLNGSRRGVHNTKCQSLHSGLGRGRGCGDSELAACLVVAGYRRGRSSNGGAPGAVGIAAELTTAAGNMASGRPVLLIGPSMVGKTKIAARIVTEDFGSWPVAIPDSKTAAGAMTAYQQAIDSGNAAVAALAARNLRSLLRQ
jgi:hypothetical protein